MNPKEIKEHADNLCSLIETTNGEITPEIDLILQGMDLTTPENVDNLHYALEMISSQADYFREQGNKLLKEARNLEAFTERQRYWIKEIIKMSGEPVLVGDIIRYRVSKGQTKLNVVESAVPLNYFKEVKTLELDKVALKKDLEAGEVIKGAELESVYRLTASMNKRKDLLETK